MEKKIPEIEARDILQDYSGSNNQLLEWKLKLAEFRNFVLTRPQADYVLRYHMVIPKVARKYVNIYDSFSQQLLEQKHLLSAPKQIWIEKLLCETEVAYHIWGKIHEKETLKGMWIPKTAIVQVEKKLNRVIDFTPYDMPNRKLMEHQKEGVYKLLPNDRFILADDMGLGKSLTINTLVYTPYGRKKIGDTKINDKIIGSNGKSYNVTGVFPQGKLDTYKITFNDGYSIICSGEHLWTVSSNNSGENSKNRENRCVTLSTNQLMSQDLIAEQKGFGWNAKRNYQFSTYYKSNNGNLKWQIPIVKPMNFENNDTLPINPYLLGLSLGDGYILEKKVRFSVHKDDYDELFKDFNLKEHKIDGNKRNGTIILGESLVNLKLNNTHSHDKFIPDIYKYSSIENRLSILRGLMDTDGTVMKSKGGAFNGTEYCTISEQLADDVAEIVHSLGGIVRKKSRIPTYTYKGEKMKGQRAYRLNIKLPEGMNPFILKRKQELYNTPKKYKVGRYIKNIEYYGEEECICISVDSPDKLYVTDHAIVTHNTTTSVVASLELNVKKVLIVCPASLKINWQREIEFYTKKKILIVEGRKWGSTFDYYIINYDILKNYHTTEDSEESEAYKLIVNEGFDLAIVDEAHYVSNTDAQRTRLLNDILEQIPKVWLLTGTPMTSRPINYYNLLKIVRAPVALNWRNYVKRYCAGFQFKVNGRRVWKTTGAAHLDELREYTKHIVLRRLKVDILDLPPKIVTPIFLELHSTFYDEELESFMRITKENKEKESITITLNRLMKVRQLIAIEKIPYTCEIIDKFVDQGKKVIVFTNFTMSLEMLHEKYKKNSVVLDGRMSAVKKQESVDIFQNNPKIKVFILNIKAGGVGWNLTAAEAVIMNDLSFVPSDHSQAEDRAFRYGQKNNVLVYYPIFDNTIERIVYNILNKKKDIIDQVMGDGEYSESFSKELVTQLKLL